MRGEAEVEARKEVVRMMRVPSSGSTSVPHLRVNEEIG
jgi:hypothetical protein